MFKYAKIIDPLTKKCDVGTGTNTEFYRSIGMVEMDVEEAYTGDWYVAGYAPVAPEKTQAEKRALAYPSIVDQLDMIYWDQVNGTRVWSDTIGAIKAKYPKA